jgi:hypothetical protein
MMLLLNCSLFSLVVLVAEPNQMMTHEKLIATSNLYNDGNDYEGGDKKYVPLFS